MSLFYGVWFSEIPTPANDRSPVPMTVEPLQMTDASFAHHYDNIALPNHEHDHGAWLDRARLMAVKIARERGSCSADDVWEACPVPDGVDRRVLGGVFKPSKDWVRVGWIQSRRRSNHGRTIPVWKLADEVNQ